MNSSSVESTHGFDLAEQADDMVTERAEEALITKGRASSLNAQLFVSHVEARNLDLKPGASFCSPLHGVAYGLHMCIQTASQSTRCCRWVNSRFAPSIRSPLDCPAPHSGMKDFTCTVPFTDALGHMSYETNYFPLPANLSDVTESNSVFIISVWAQYLSNGMESTYLGAMIILPPEQFTCQYVLILWQPQDNSAFQYRPSLRIQ